MDQYPALYADGLIELIVRNLEDLVEASLSARVCRTDRFLDICGLGATSSLLLEVLAVLATSTSTMAIFNAFAKLFTALSI